MKKLVQSLFLLALCSFLIACGSESTSSNTSEGPLSEEELEYMYTDPKKYKGSEVEFYARVFVEPERDGESIYFQAFMHNNSDRNVIVKYDDPNLDIKEDDSVLVNGIVYDVFEGENLFGATLKAPVIEAKKVDKVSYAEAFAPARKTIEVNQTKKQHGIEVTLEKVEIADEETRLYVTVKNNSKDEFTLYDSDSKLIIGNKQLEPQDNFEANYPEIPYDILPGIESNGIITFPKIEENTATARWHVDGYSNNFNISIKPFIFEFEIK